MTDRNDSSSNDPKPAGNGSNRRAMLKLGAASASAVVMVKPALAQTTGSVLNCEIPVPSGSAGGQYIDADGSLVPPDTPGAFAPPYRDFTGEEVRRAMNGSTLPGTDREASNAYVNYIRRLQHGQSGFTCYASLQMPR